MNIQAIVKEEIVEKSGKNGFLKFDEVDLKYMTRKEGTEELVKGFSFRDVKNPSEEEVYMQVNGAIEDAISKLSVPFEICQSIIMDLKVISEYGTYNRMSVIEHFMKQHVSKHAEWTVTYSVDDALPKNVTNQILLYVKY